jgi:putative peptide zinc metalloprotease protein
MAAATFSEHWHRVAYQRVALRPAVQTRKQMFRGERCYLVLDPLNNAFFRVSAEAHEFICRLGRGATVEEVWQRCMERDPDGAPGQEEVVGLLSQLHQANLLRGELPPDSAKLLERQRKRQRRELRAWFNPMAVRFPLLDPDRFLCRALPLVRWLMGPIGLLLWLVVLGAAGKVALEHWAALKEQSQGVLAPGNLPLLYAGTLLLKTLHEFGHAFACRRFGGEVHRMGVMLLYFLPVPYVDATASWAFRGKWPRIFVGAAGMIVELFVAALAVFVWAVTGDGALHSVAYNLIFVASVTTVLFNANPLLRYDGYYILSDLLEIPNLHMNSLRMLRHLAEKYLFGCTKSESPAESHGEAVLLTVFGVASWIYRVVVFFGIALWVSDQFLLLGVLLALSCVFSFTIQPLWKLVRYLATSPSLARNRRRAVLVTSGLAAVLPAMLAWWPMPSRFRAPGILRAEEYAEVFTGTTGTLREVLAASGSVVAKGQPLLRIESRELDFELTGARAEVTRSVAEERRALERSAADLGPLQNHREVAEKRVRRLEEQQRALLLVAPQAGVWVSPRINERVGMWLMRGERMGQVVQDAEFRFTAVISQEEAANLFNGTFAGSQVRILGQSDRALDVSGLRVIPANQQTLPSSALGWAAGGEVATSLRDPSGVLAAEPFFELRAAISPQDGVTLLHGRSGKIRVELRHEPLLVQWHRTLRQLLQKKYQL